MAENKQRQKLIHLHTSEVKVPTQGLLDRGEIAVQHNDTEAALYIEKNNGTIAKFIDESAVNTKIAVETARAEGIEDGLANRISTLEGSNHTHANKTVLDGITSAKVDAWDAAEANAKKYADSLAKNYDAAGAAATAKSEVIGTSDDTKDSNTIKGAKKYADTLNSAMDTRVNALEGKVDAWDAAEANAISSAKTYTDSAITALNLAETYAKKEVEGKISTLIGADTGKSIRSVAAEEVAKVVANAPEDFDTLKENADRISTDTTGSAQMANDISALKAISADTRLVKLENVSHSHSNKDLLDSYTQTNDNLADAVAKKHEHTNKEVLDGITAIKVAAWDAAEANASAYTDSAITALDLANKYEAKGAAADAFASAKTYTDGLDAAMGSRVDALTSAVTDNEKVVAAALNQIIESVGLDGSGNSPLPGNISLVDAVSTLSGSNHTHANKDVLDGITAQKVAAWETAEANAKADAAAKYQVKGDYEAAGAAAQALKDAKSYADGALEAAKAYTDEKLIEIDCGEY